MPILKINCAVERYRYLAKPDFGIHKLAGHGDDGEPNVHFLSSRILDVLKPDENDVVVDIGCGDGHLLASAAELGSLCIGVIPTEEEQTKLQSTIPGVTFTVGLAQKLPLAPQTASKIVCNGVLLLLESQENVTSALQEIARIAIPGARIWIGEVPSADEFSAFHVYNRGSVVGLLWHELSDKGLRSFLSTLKLALKSMLTKETLLINSYGLFYSPPESFIHVAEECGLRIENCSKHVSLNGSGKPVQSLYRYNYIFTRPSERQGQLS